ncbi:MAG: S8 family serine peptidase [Chitinophagales bacterium]
MDKATFKYGYTTLSISKSNRFIAVNKRDSTPMTANMPANARSAAPAIKSTSTRLGKFEILEASFPSFESVENTLNNVRAMDTVNVGTHVFHTTTDGDVPYIPSGQVYIEFTAATQTPIMYVVFEHLHLAIIEKRGSHTYVVNVTPQSPNPIKVVVALQGLEMVKVAEPELLTPAGLNSLALPSDDLLKNQWHLENKGNHGNWGSNAFKAGSDAKVVEAWKYMKSLGSSQITVAVIDSGFDLNHPDLRGNGNKITAPWDFETDTPDPTPHLGDWHGTPVAGVAIGAANGTGIVGAAPNAKFIPMRFSWISDSQIEKWFTYAAQNGADVISNSWGSQDANFVMSTRMVQAIRKCAIEGRNGKGCVIVFAAGNSGRSINKENQPDAVTGFATHPNIIAIAASNSKDERSSYSNFGKRISVCAPSNGSGGAGVTTADVGGTIVLPSGGTGHKGYDAGYFTHGFGGTSSACPLAAGICALILSVKPSLRATQVKEILETTADKIGDRNLYNANGHSKYFGYGRINTLNAIKKALGDTIPDIPVVDIPDNGGNTGGGTGTGGNTGGGNTGGGTGGNTGGGNDKPPTINEIRTIPMKGVVTSTLRQSNERHIYKISLNHRMVINMTSPSGTDRDFDLYVRKGGVPDPKNRKYDISSTSEGSNEKVVLSNPSSGSYFIMARAYQGKGSFNLEATLEVSAASSGIQELPLQALIGGILRDRLEENTIKVNLGGRLKIRMEVPVGSANNDFDLYIKRNGIPNKNDYDGRSIQEGSVESILLNNVQSGDYYIVVQSFEGSGGYNLTVSLE